MIKTEQIRQDLYVKVKNLMLAAQRMDLQAVVQVFSISWNYTCPCHPTFLENTILQSPELFTKALFCYGQ